MPYFKIETNKTLDVSDAKDFAKEASSFACRLLGKPEKYMMVSICHSAALMFGGVADPAAFVELKSIGLLEANCKGYSRAICEFLESNLKIPPDRIYIDFKDIDPSMFGWNKTTF
jgi:phenylpyruvate tautomerase